MNVLSEYPTVDPLFPIASRAQRRAEAAAAQLGLVAVPYFYDAVVPPSAVGSLTFTFNVDFTSSNGPIVITDVAPPVARRLTRAVIKQDSAFLTDGTVVVGDAFVTPRDFSGRLSSSPLCFNAGEQFFCTLEDESTPWALGEGVRIVGVGVRKLQGGQLGPVNDELSQRWVDMVAAEGVWWGTSIAGTKATAFQPVTGNAVIECILVAVDINTTEGFGGPNNLLLKIGAHQVTPNSFDPRLGSRVVVNNSPMIVTMLPGLRMPVKAKTRIQVEQVTYPSAVATKIPYRVTVLGRRGGIAGDCWAA